MKHWKKDDIVEEVHKMREQTAQREEADPKKFHREVRKLAKKFGIKKSPLKPIKIDLSKLRKKIKWTKLHNLIWPIYIVYLALGSKAKADHSGSCHSALLDFAGK